MDKEIALRLHGDHALIAETIIDAALADYAPVADARVLEEEAHAEIHDLVEGGWIEGTEEELLFGWFSKYHKTESTPE